MSSTPPFKEQSKDTDSKSKTGSSSSKKEFLKPEMNPELDAVDYWNMYGTWKDSIPEKSKFIKIDEKGNLEIPLLIGDPFKVTLKSFMFTAPKGCSNDKLHPGNEYTRFMILAIYKFKGNIQHARSFIEYSVLNQAIPYIRVGVNYFKVIKKFDRYKVERSKLIGWKKGEIRQDHGNKLFQHLNRFDDFCIVPDNTNHQAIINNEYNLYSPFNHKPVSYQVTQSDIPNTIEFLKHIFGEQFDLGLIYFKVLYENPKQALPILCLVSRVRETGKTTYLNWLEMIYGDNYVLINPEDISSDFNSSYATKNIIALDETVIDKSHAVERLKSIATAKSISVNEKFVSNYSIPFFGKIVICSNKERDFMRIDKEEIRFWVRKVPVIKSIKTNLELSLYEEIPKFLKFLNQLPEVDNTKSRMIFTSEQLRNSDLLEVMEESQTWLYTELVDLITEHFLTNSLLNEFYATRNDIKEKFFKNRDSVTANYIRKVLRDELEIKTEKCQRYIPFGETEGFQGKKPGTPYLFKREQFVKSEPE